MRLPRWYRRTCAIWLVGAPLFWWFATGFHGEPFFSLPRLNGPSSGGGWEIGLVIQLSILAALLAPVTTFPLVLLTNCRRRRGIEND
jgi:hypothetical protein